MSAAFRAVSILIVLTRCSTNAASTGFWPKAAPSISPSGVWQGMSKVTSVEMPFGLSNAPTDNTKLGSIEGENNDAQRRNINTSNYSRKLDDTASNYRPSQPEDVKLSTDFRNGDNPIQRKDNQERDSEHDHNEKSSNSTDSSVIKSIKDNVVAIKQPIVQTITAVGSSQCANVKRLFGVTYDQIQEKEPDLNQLKLHVKNDQVLKIYKIGEAAYAVPRDLRDDRKMVIFIHGFTDDPTKASFQNISESFLDQSECAGSCNVIALDGSSLIKWLYIRATTYVRFMGEKLGAVLAAMVRSGLNPQHVLIVGHSLGAHVAGFTGKTFRNLTGLSLGRISGLDPAGPCFTEMEDALRLNRDDADFVDVIHTDAGVYGITETIGHADFFVNGGSHQPNCFFETCSHSRSWLLYSESIHHPRAFPARRCKDWRTFEQNACDGADIVYMGYSTPGDVRGSYYLQTSGDVPYGRGEMGLMFDGSKATAKKVIDAGSVVVDEFKDVATKILG